MVYFEQWYETGNIVERGEHKNGRKHGLCTNWDNMGEIVSTEMYENGKVV